MDRFARLVIDIYEAGDRERLRPAFDIVERGFESGGTEIRDALVVGFLEALQNIASHRAYGAEVFVPFLGTHSRQAWNELNVAWAGKESLADVVAAERGVSLPRRWWQFWRRRDSPKQMLAKVQNSELRAIIESMTREAPKK